MIEIHLLEWWKQHVFYTYKYVHWKIVASCLMLVGQNAWFQSSWSATTFSVTAASYFCSAKIKKMKHLLYKMQIHLHVTHKMRMMMIYAHLANWIWCMRRRNSKSYMCRSVRTFVCLVPNISIRRWQIWAVGWRKLKPRPTLYTVLYQSVL